MNSFERISSKYSCAKYRGALAALLASVTLLMACGTGNRVGSPERVVANREAAVAMWKERCGRSGEMIHQTVKGVDGVFLINVRMRNNSGESATDQFALDDPYGADLIGDAYINTFLRDSFRFHYSESGVPKGWPPHFGYKFVEAIDPRDGQLYRYAGVIVEPWQVDKKYPKGYLQFSLERTPISARSARYGIQYKDVSTREEREHWIAGSSLQVIDLESKALVAERIGYMIDPTQGDRTGGRSPWLYAAAYACPEFARDLPEAARRQAPKSLHQLRQTQRFVEKVITPAP